MLNEHEHDINRCLQLIYKAKEHRHDKIKRKQIDKFEHLYFKKHGYHHNFLGVLQILTTSTPTDVL